MTELAALVLAAGEGSRLRPLTCLRPKPLCPVGNVALVDHALDRVAQLMAVHPGSVAVNVHHLAGLLVEHLAGRVRVSDETARLLGTAGAVGALRAWLDGRDLLIANADVYLGDADWLPEFVTTWDRRAPRLLVVEDRERADFAGHLRFAGVSLLPNSIASTLDPVPSGLYQQVWRRGGLDLVETRTRFFDCGTPRDYLAANLSACAGGSAVAPSARVFGRIERCVVWPDAVVLPEERLADCVRARGATGEPVTLQVR